MIFSSIVASSSPAMEIALPRFESILAAPSRGGQGNYVPFSIRQLARYPCHHFCRGPRDLCDSFVNM